MDAPRRAFGLAVLASLVAVGVGGALWRFETALDDPLVVFAAFAVELVAGVGGAVLARRAGDGPGARQATVFFGVLAALVGVVACGFLLLALFVGLLFEPRF